MNTIKQIHDYIQELPESKRADMQTLHEQMLQLLSGCRLWFLDGKDENGKIVSNPNIGYGVCSIHYKNGTSREFYRIGISANTSGISVYFMGLEDKTLLATTYGADIGKAKVTGYCIQFKRLEDIRWEVLAKAIREVSDRDN